MYTDIRDAWAVFAASPFHGNSYLLNEDTVQTIVMRYCEAVTTDDLFEEELELQDFVSLIMKSEDTSPELISVVVNKHLDLWKGFTQGGAVPNVKVAAAGLRNLNCPPNVLIDAVLSGDNLYRQIALLNPNCPEEAAVAKWLASGGSPW